MDEPLSRPPVWLVFLLPPTQFVLEVIARDIEEHVRRAELVVVVAEPRRHRSGLTTLPVVRAAGAARNAGPLLHDAAPALDQVAARVGLFRTG